MSKRKIISIFLVLILVSMNLILPVTTYAEDVTFDYKEYITELIRNYGHFETPQSQFEIYINGTKKATSPLTTDTVETVEELPLSFSCKVGDEITIKDISKVGSGSSIVGWDLQIGKNYTWSGPEEYVEYSTGNKTITADKPGTWVVYLNVRDNYSGIDNFQNWSQYGNWRTTAPPKYEPPGVKIRGWYFTAVKFEVEEPNKPTADFEIRYSGQDVTDNQSNPVGVSSYPVTVSLVDKSTIDEGSISEWIWYQYDGSWVEFSRSQNPTFSVSSNEKRFRLKVVSDSGVESEYTIYDFYSYIEDLEEPPGDINAVITGPSEIEKGRELTLDSSSSTSVYPIVQRKWYRRTRSSGNWNYYSEWDNKITITDDIPDDTDRSYYEYKLEITDSKGNTDEAIHRVDLLEKAEVGVNANLIFDPEFPGLNETIYVTPEQYANNEEITIDLWLTAKKTTYSKIDLGGFWFFSDVTEHDINHLKPDLRDNIEHDNFIDYIEINTRTNPESLEDTYVRGTFTFKPQNPTVKAALIVRNRNGDSDDKNWDYATAYHTLDVEVFNPYPSISVTLDTSNDNGVGINVENLTSTDIESKFPTSYTEWKIETLEGNLIMDGTGLVPSWIEYNESFNKKDFFKVTQYAENTLGNIAYDTAVFALNPEFDFDVQPKILFVGEEVEVIDKSKGMLDKRWYLRGDNINGTQEIELSPNNTFTQYEPGIYKVAFQADGYFTNDVNIYYYTNDKRELEVRKPIGPLSEIVKEQFGDEAIFISGSQSWDGEIEEGNFVSTQLGESNFNYRRSVKLQFLSKETRYNEKTVRFVTLKPIAALNISGNYKMYKEVFLNGSFSVEATDSILQENYPILFSHPKTQFVIEPLDEDGNIDTSKNKYILGNGKEIINDRVVFRGKKFQSVRFDKEGDYRVKYKVYNGKEESDFAIQIIHIEPELYPTASIEVSNSLVYRNPDNKLRTTIEVFVEHNSEDDEINIEKSKLLISFDMNNDMNFENDGEHSSQWISFNDENLAHIDGRKYINVEYISDDLTHFIFTVDNETKNLFGNFEFNFLAVEKPSIPNYTEVGYVPTIQSDTLHIDPTKKRVLIDNMAPVIDLNIGSKREVNIWILEVYGHNFTEQEIEMLRHQLELEKIKANIYIIDEGNNVRIIE